MFDNPNSLQKQILFICDFSSSHSRSLIGYFSKQKSLVISVISTFWAEEMEGVYLILLNKDRLDSKSSAVKLIANIIQNLSSSLYLKLSAFRLKRISKRLSLILKDTELSVTPDIIHILRTQPEGLSSVEFLKCHSSRKYLTTWGQDFVLWANSDAWMKKQTQALLQQIDNVYPDNHRDERIIREDYQRSSINSFVMPATGGLQLEFLDKFDNLPIINFKNQITFFTNRGYPSSFVKLKELLQAYKNILSIHPDSHFYIDLMSRTDIERDKTIKNWIRELGIEQSITILHLSREETFAYLRSCDYYVTATMSDGLPLSLLESIYFGIIPIVYNHESTSNLLLEFEKIYCYDDFNPEVISECVRNAIRDNKLSRESHTFINRKIIREKYNQEINLQKTLGHYLSNE